MATNNTATQTAPAKVGQQAPVRSKADVQTLDSSLDKLAKYGGFNFLETSIDGIQNLNPERKARKNVFLTDKQKQSEREALANTLDMWIALLSESDDINQMIESSKKKSESVSAKLAESQLRAVEAVKKLERSYRGVMLFYKNTEEDKVSNVTIVNASKEQITDLDNSRFIDYVAEELKQYYDKLDLRQNYSYLGLPGYLGSNAVLDKWSKIADASKVRLFTDFMDLDRVDDVVDMFFSANHSGGDVYKSHTTMACNWLIGRPKYKELKEEEDLRVSPSMALMGAVYKTIISQVTAGKKYGVINEVENVAFQMRKSELSHLEKMGLIPMVREYGKVMAFSGRTLFNGDNIGLQTYSVVSTFDNISKTLIDFLNRRAFENWSSKTEKDLHGQMIKFLDSVQGPDRLIKEFKILRLEQDKNVKDKIYLDLYLTPFFPGKSFVIGLEGTKGQDVNEWLAEISQA